MSKIIYITTEALRMALNKDYGMKLPTDTKFVLTSESDKEREQNYVADLEKQLAEKEKEIKALKSKEKKIQLHTKRDWFERCCMLEDKSISLGLENIELKQQLAEKDVDLSLARNEIDTLKHNLNISQEHDNVICEQYFEKCKQHSQEKISFAVAELEKVRDYIEKSTFYNVKLAIDIFYDYEFYKLLDNQIKQLKEGK